MVVIRLRRAGSKKRPFFRVVVTDSRSARDSSFVEILGHYNPRTKPAVVQVDKERVDYWIGKGAQPSDSVRTLIARHLTPVPAATVPAEAPWAAPNALEWDGMTFGQWLDANSLNAEAKWLFTLVFTIIIAEDPHESSLLRILPRDRIVRWDRAHVQHDRGRPGVARRRRLAADLAEDGRGPRTAGRPRLTGDRDPPDE